MYVQCILIVQNILDILKNSCWSTTGYCEFWNSYYRFKTTLISFLSSFTKKKNDLRSLLNNDHMMYYFTTLWWHTTPPTLIHNLHWPTPLFHFITIPFFRAKKEDLVDLDRCIDPGLSSIIIVNQHHCDEDTRFRIW